MYTEKKSNLMPLVLILGILGLFLWVFFGQYLHFSASSTGSGGEHGIFVTGEGTVETIPDIAQVSFEMEVDADTAGKAQAANTAILNRILDNVKNFDIKTEDLQTGNPRLSPIRNYVKSAHQEKVVGYHLVNQLKLTIRDLSKLGPIIDAAIASGAGQMENITYSVASPENWQAKAIGIAVKNARSKAEAMATAAGLTIKGVSFMSDTVMEIVPFQTRVIPKEQNLSGGEQNTPVIEGKVTVQTRLQMGFGI